MRYNSLGKLVKDEDDLWNEVHALRDENASLRKRIKELEENEGVSSHEAVDEGVDKNSNLVCNGGSRRCGDCLEGHQLVEAMNRIKELETENEKWRKANTELNRESIESHNLIKELEDKIRSNVNG